MEQKYLKYKSKYLDLLNQSNKSKNNINLVGGNFNVTCNYIDSFTNFPTLTLKDEKGYHYIDAKYDPITKYYTAKWCKNINMGLWSLSENTIIEKKIVNNKQELLDMCGCKECKVINSIKKFPTKAIKDSNGYRYIDVSYNPVTKSYFGKWCNNPNIGTWEVKENTVIGNYNLNNKYDLAKFCEC